MHSLPIYCIAQNIGGFNLVVDSQSTKVLSVNVFFHYDFVQAVAIAK